MSCIALTALEATMATTELTRGVNYENLTPWLPQNTEQKPVQRNWVAVTDDNGNQKLRMRWRENRTG